LISKAVVDWISQRKTGCILYSSPSRVVRDASLKAMAQIAVCPLARNQGLSCDCADCFNIKADTHPHVVSVTEETFDERMKILYSLPTPVIQLSELHKVSPARQTKLLIWLESFLKDRFVLMTCESEFSILPTIRSRSVIFTEIPRYTMSEDDFFKTKVFVQSLFSGREKFESVSTPDDAKKMARNVHRLLVEEIQGRMTRPPKKTLPGSDIELTTLLKVLERFLVDPATHNLRLLLSGFMMFILQGAH
jgi:hypothetical protein